MAYYPTDEDYRLLEQQNLVYYIKIEVRNNGKTINENTTIIDSLEGILVGGNNSITADSDVRRTASITFVPIENRVTISNGSDNTIFDMSERSKIWLNKNSILSVGILDLHTKEVKYYKMGTYTFQTQSITYDNTTNQMSVNMADLMIWLDGTTNGQMGTLTTLIPAYKEDPDTGEVLSYNVIKDAMMSIVSQEGNVSRYIIDDIGETKGLRQYNPVGWQQYRNEHPLWDNIPYDLEFAAGCSVSEIIIALRDLYPNNETFFDIDGVFRCQSIPSLYYDDVIIPDHMLRRYLISENTNRDFTTVKNVSEVWGQVLDTDYYSEDVENQNGVYTCDIEGYDEEYKNADRVALKVPCTNVSNQAININGFGNIIIYNSVTEEPLENGVLNANQVYVFLCRKELVSGSGQDKEYSVKFYLQGKWQIHAMSVLTDGTVSEDMWTDPETKVQYPLYSMEYFKLRYNVDTVEFTINPQSPYTIQKIGVRLAVYSGAEYDALFTDDLALTQAHYENWKTARLTDNITLSTILMPFLDVNTKVSYRMQNSDEIKQYIIKSISHDFSGLQSSITMMTFYPLYESGNSTNYYDSFVVIKGTQQFVSKYFVNAYIKNRENLVTGDIIWYMYHGNYRTVTVGGIGGTEKIGGKNVQGIPWVNAYPNGGENISNYLTKNRYRTSSTLVTNQFQKAGQFKYVLKDTSGQLVANGTNDAAGNIRFEGVDTNALSDGTNIFYASQVSTGISGITYDTSVKNVSIVITNEGNSRYYETTYDVTFVNTY